MNQLTETKTFSYNYIHHQVGCSSEVFDYFKDEIFKISNDNYLEKKFPQVGFL